LFLQEKKRKENSSQGKQQPNNFYLKFTEPGSDSGAGEEVESSLKEDVSFQDLFSLNKLTMQKKKNSKI
jgi:hypothetical protein